MAFPKHQKERRVTNNDITNATYKNTYAQSVNKEKLEQRKHLERPEEKLFQSLNQFYLPEILISRCSSEH